MSEPSHNHIQYIFLPHKLEEIRNLSKSQLSVDFFFRFFYFVLFLVLFTISNLYGSPGGQSGFQLYFIVVLFIQVFIGYLWINKTNEIKEVAHTHINYLSEEMRVHGVFLYQKDHTETQLGTRYTLDDHYLALNFSDYTKFSWFSRHSRHRMVEIIMWILISMSGFVVAQASFAGGEVF